MLANPLKRQQAQAELEGPMDLQLLLANFQPSDHQLQFAAFRGCYRTTEQLLSRPLDPNCVTESDGEISEIQTPLGMACREGHAEVVSLLLEAMADVSMEFGPDGMEETPLGVSVERHDVRITQMLLHARAEANAVHYSTGHGCFQFPVVLAPRIVRKG